MPFIQTTDGAELYYKDWGSGRPVVLIHGWPLSADMWEGVHAPLAAAGFRVIAYDRRGFGRSTQTWEGYEYDTLADDLQAVLDGLDLRDAGIVGFSMGGGEVARYMSRHHASAGDGRVAKAVLVSAVTPYLLKTPDHDGADRSVFEGMIDGLKTDRPKFLAGFWHQVFNIGIVSSPVSAEALQWTTNIAMLASPKATIECVKAFGYTDFCQDLAAFKVPTLVIHGDKDQVVPFDISGKLAAQSIQGAKLIVYEGGPHGLPVTHADRLTEDLKSFLA